MFHELKEGCVLPQKLTVYLSRNIMPTPGRKRRWVLFLLVCMISLLVWGSYLVKSWQQESAFVVTGQVVYEDAGLANVYVMAAGSEALTEIDGSFVLRINHFGYVDFTIEKDQFESQHIRKFIWRRVNQLEPIYLQRSSAYAGVFEGIVLDAFEERPVADALIKISGRTAQSDHGGRFSLQNLNTGERIVKVASPGYRDLEQPVRVTTDETGPIPFELTPNGRFVFTKTLDGQRDIYTTSLDGRYVENVTSELDQEAWGGVMAPDGEKVLFFSSFESGGEFPYQKTGLYMAVPGDDTTTRISRDLIVDSQLEVSPDSRYVLFAAKEFPDAIPELYLAELTRGGSFRQLTFNSVYETQFRISPDARTVIYSAYTEGSRDLFRVNTLDYTEERLTVSTGYEQDTVFSPAGDAIYFVRHDTDTGSTLVELDLHTDTPRTLYRSLGEIDALTINHEGDKIAFTVLRDQRPALMIRTIKGDLRPTEIVTLPHRVDQLMWPKVGRYILMTGLVQGGREVSVVHVSERKYKELFTADAHTVSFLAR